MKQPRKLTPPVKDTRKELFFEIIQRCTEDYHDGEQYGEWRRSYDSSLKAISRNKDLLNKWDFESHKVPDEVYDAKFLYAVVVTYSSGDTFGHSTGNIQVAFVTEDPDEALECKLAINEQDECEKESRYFSHRRKEKLTKTMVWDEKFQNHPKSVCSYAPWNGYFEGIEMVDIVFLPVMG